MNEKKLREIVFTKKFLLLIVLLGILAGMLTGCEDQPTMETRELLILESSNDVDHQQAQALMLAFSAMGFAEVESDTSGSIKMTRTFMLPQQQRQLSDFERLCASEFAQRMVRVQAGSAVLQGGQ